MENVNVLWYENEKYKCIKIIINMYEVNYKRFVFDSIIKIVCFGKMDLKKKIKIIVILLFWNIEKYRGREN